MAAEEMVHTYAARVIGGKAAPCMSRGLAWSYLRASYDQSHVRFRNPDHPIRLNAAFRLDLQWWIDFVEEWNGTKFFLLPGLMPLADLWVTSDAAGSIGYGAVYHQQWFNHVWLPAQRPLSIAYKEFFPVVVAAHLWGLRLGQSSCVLSIR